VSGVGFHKTEVRDQRSENRNQMTRLRASCKAPANGAEYADLSSVFCYLSSVIWSLTPEH